jgi:hypothetical protein
MSRGLIALAAIFFGSIAAAAPASLLPGNLGSYRKTASEGIPPPDPAIFQEFGFAAAESANYRGAKGQGTLIAYQMKDATAALAAWEWLRPAGSHRCDDSPYCAEDDGRVLILDANYVLEFRGITPDKDLLQSLATGLPGRRESAPPPVLAFVPHKNLVVNSAKYLLGPGSLGKIAPQLAGARPGFDEGAEAHFTEYRLDGGIAKLVLFYYPSPEMARLHTVAFKAVSGTQVKRSGVLVAIVLPGATERQADAILGQVEYEAKITWNEPPEPDPMPVLYSLLVNIIYLCIILAALCLTAGVMYGLMRLYRRRFGTLDEDEAMTTLHLTVRE